MRLCRHFGLCGGCTLQNLSAEDYQGGKRTAITAALERAGLAGIAVEPPLMVPQASRRRAVFKFAKMQAGVEIGFHAAKSHQIVDMRECLVLAPELFGVTRRLRTALAPILGPGEKGEVHVTASQTGLDMAFRWNRKLTPALTTALAGALSGRDIARVIVNGEIVLEQSRPVIRIAGAQVRIPPHAFLQATAQGEAALQEQVLALTAGAKHIADLFCGLGTFTLALAAKARVHAVEQDGEALAALAEAARTTSGMKPVTTEKRDLFKRPLAGAELKPYDAVVLDPPRAGAPEQVRALAASAVPRIAYVSCDAQSFARDAAILAAGGYTPGPVTPIDQFLFSAHIELVGGFARRRR